jgi:hypothetical protein
LTRGSQVVVIGDSFMTVNTPYLTTQRLAQAAGAPTPFRSYAVPGTQMIPGQIPAQLTRAISADPDIKLLIMNGGGNNILIGAPQCLSADPNTNPQCAQVIAEARRVSEELMNTAMNAGIRDVIYFGYPKTPIGGAALNDYANVRAKQSCDDAVNRTGGRLRCHFVDLVPVFEGHPEYFGLDPIHPNAAGAQAIGTAVWNVMQQNCLGQAAGSACCM